jgi:hypothetical protein
MKEVSHTQYLQSVEFNMHAWAGSIRIGCLLEEPRQIGGDGFSISVATGQYLVSETFKSHLSGYYEELTGRMCLARPAALLLHCRTYNVPRIFFDNFMTLLRSTFQESETLSGVYDDQTFNSERLPYEAFLNYEHICTLFDVEESIGDSAVIGNSRGSPTNSAFTKEKYRSLL